MFTIYTDDLSRFDSAAAVAKEMGIAPEVLKKTFDTYNQGAKNKNDPFGKKVMSAPILFNYD